MTRDEVLERLEEKIQSSEFFQIEVFDIQFLRAAAELIRQSGWAKLHDGLDRDTGLTCGTWEELPNGKHRWYVCSQKMCPGFAMSRGYTHYLPEPEPPAREVENG